MATSSNNSVWLTADTGSTVTTTVAALSAVDLGAFWDCVRCGNPSTAKYSGIYLGTGTTPPQKSDYKLEAVIASGLSISNGRRLFLDEGNGKYSYSAQAVVKNTSGADITITEMGYYGYLSVGAILFERRVLDNPITIKAGESKLLTNKITFNQSQ